MNYIQDIEKKDILSFLNYTLIQIATNRRKSSFYPKFKATSILDSVHQSQHVLFSKQHHQHSEKV